MISDGPQVNRRKGGRPQGKRKARRGAYRSQAERGQMVVEVGEGEKRRAIGSVEDSSDENVEGLWKKREYGGHEKMQFCKGRIKKTG